MSTTEKRAKGVVIRAYLAMSQRLPMARSGLHRLRTEAQRNAFSRLEGRLLRAVQQDPTESVGLYVSWDEWGAWCLALDDHTGG